MMKIALLSLALTLGATTAAHASGDWAMIGAGCTVDPTSAPYTIASGVVTFAGTSTGTILLWCPMTPTIDAPTTFEIQAYDNNTTGAVSSWLVKINANTGAVTNVTGPTTTTSSSVQNVPIGITGQYDPANYRYGVLVQLTRTNSSGLVMFYGSSIY